MKRRPFLVWALFLAILCVGMVLLSYMIHRYYLMQNSPAPIVLAPANVPVISSPQELSVLLPLWHELQQKSISVYPNEIAIVTTGQTIGLSQDSLEFASFRTFSSDGRYMLYQRQRGMGHDRLEMLDLATGNIRILAEQEEFPGSTFFGSVSISPDNRQVIFAVYWENAGDLVKLDLTTDSWRRLNVNVLLGGFGETDISPDGRIVVKCVRPSRSRVFIELCLLDEEGQFIRYLTEENYAWTGYGKFTPDGQWVVYESRYRLFRVRTDGEERQLVAPCALGGPLLVTQDYAVVDCYVSEEPFCRAVFITDLDENNFWRIGYLEPSCETR